MNPKFEYVGCKCCGGNETVEVFKARENQFGIGTEFCVVKCKRCGLVFVNPRPIAEDIGEYYPKDSYYTHASVEESYESNRKRWTLKSKVLAGIYADRSDEAKLPLLVQVQYMLLKVALKRFIAIVVPFVKGGKLLDVGCGNGIFLKMMRQYGWETYGVEISDSCVMEARKEGINVFKGNLEEAQFGDKQMDVVVANQVLEHVYDPVKFLKECRRILKDEGLLVIGVPNFGSYDSKLFRENWSALQVPTHLYHFTPDTLGRVLREAGFKVEYKYQSLLMQYNKQYININIQNAIDETGSTGPRNRKNEALKKISLLLKLFFVKPALFLFGPRRGPAFSVNVTAYATKLDGRQR